MWNRDCSGSADDVGRQIQILDGKEYEDYRSGWCESMKDLIGQVYEVIGYNRSNDSYVIRDENDDRWCIDCDKCILLDEEDVEPCGDIMMIL